MEAMWLAALIVAPLLFSPAADRIFELSNTVFVRVLGLGMLCVAVGRWMVHRPGMAHNTPPSRLDVAGLLRFRDPVTLAATGLLTVSVISTVFSVAPATSLLGSHLRNQGAYTTFAYVAIFIVVSSTMRNLAQVQRATFTMLLAAFFVAAYAILQHYGLDPIILGTAWESTRVSSTLGNPVFLGGFLILVIPLAMSELLTLYRSSATGTRLTSPRILGGFLILSLGAFIAIWIGVAGRFAGGVALTQEAAEVASSRFTRAVLLSAGLLLLWGLASQRMRQSQLLVLGTHTFLLSTLVAGLVLSGSRGPILGLVAGILMFVLLYGAVRRQSRLALATIASAALLFAALALFQDKEIRASTGLCNNPMIGRIICNLDPTDAYQRPRVLIWQGALRLVMPHPPLRSPSGGPDPYNGLRPWIGYGPETLLSIFPAVAPPELERIMTAGVRVDRAHNSTLDSLAETGVFGAAASLALVASAWYLGLDQLGLLAGRSRKRVFWLSLAVGCGISPALASQALGESFIGPGVSLGLVAGGLTFVALSAFRRLDGPPWHPEVLMHLPVIGVLSAITAHVVEIQVGFPTTPSQVYTWFLLALLVSHARLKPDNLRVTEVAASSDPGADPTREALTLGVVTGLVLAVAGFGFLQAAGQAETSSPFAAPFHLIGAGFLQIPTVNGPRFEASLALVVLLLSAVGLTLALGMIGLGREGTRFFGRATVFGSAALTVFSTLTLGGAAIAWLAAGGALPWSGWLFPGKAGLLALGIILIALTLPEDRMVQQPRPFLAWWRAALALPIALLVSLWIIKIDFGALLIGQLSARADDAQAGTELIVLSEWITAIQPQQHHSVVRMADAYTNGAVLSSDPHVQAQLLARADAAWRRAQALNPYELENEVGLARLERVRATLAADPSRQLTHWNEVLRHDQEALRLSPHAPYLHVFYAMDLLSRATLLEHIGLGGEASQDRGIAQAAVTRALELDPRSCLAIAGRATLRQEWRDILPDALTALQRSGCHPAANAFTGMAEELATQAILRAWGLATEGDEGDSFSREVRERSSPTLTLAMMMAMARSYQADGRSSEALALAEIGIQVWPTEIAEAYADLLRQILHGTGSSGEELPPKP